jgi:type I restriction enzyme M protein
MIWNEPADTESTNAQLEARLWDSANTLWANAALKPSEYSPVVLGLIFLRFADVRFAMVHADLKPAAGSRRKIGPADYHAEGVLYLPESARFEALINLPEGAEIGEAINAAMRSIEKENTDLADVLPKTYHILENSTLTTLLKDMNSIPMDRGGDTFGLIYEYFLGKFAMSEGQKGGEFYTPTSLVKLIVDILEPYHGRILDPACGSGGMFVQSARFVENHHKNPTAEISVYGQERVTETSRLARLNLAVHGLTGEIKQGNTFYEDLHDCPGKFDFVLANPPFNVSKVDKERLVDDLRYPFGLPKTDNANYLWIQQFHAALNDKGRAGFVMANSASDARSSEQDIRQKLIESGAVDVMVAIGPNFFYTVTLPCALWFFDKSKLGTEREDQVLFIDARHIFRQIDRAHRDFTPAQSEFISNIVRLYRGEQPELTQGSEAKLKEVFGESLAYANVAGLCGAANRAAIKAQGWSLNPGRYVGVAKGEELSDEDFKEQFEALNEELVVLNTEARELEELIAESAAEVLEQS